PLGHYTSAEHRELTGIAVLAIRASSTCRHMVFERHNDWNRRGGMAGGVAQLLSPSLLFAGTTMEEVRMPKHRVARLLTLITAVAYGPAMAYPENPFLTPEHPTAQDAIIINASAGPCDTAICICRAGGNAQW
ncbi:MAG: hypothetical protein ACTHK2_14390, partial [Dokdonella sp.]|uniref:hypothetical protein n=1 Tax=Dokdonella sp. TaxID=2291710 RepID=UPI003F7DBBA9